MMKKLEGTEIKNWSRLFFHQFSLGIVFAGLAIFLLELLLLFVHGGVFAYEYRTNIIVTEIGFCSYSIFYVSYCVIKNLRFIKQLVKKPRENNQ
jgi:hypothetical protein